MVLVSSVASTAQGDVTDILLNYRHGQKPFNNNTASNNTSGVI